MTRTPAEQPRTPAEQQRVNLIAMTSEARPEWLDPPIDYRAEPEKWQAYDEHRAVHKCHQSTCEIANNLIPRKTAE